MKFVTRTRYIVKLFVAVKNDKQRDGLGILRPLSSLLHMYSTGHEISNSVP